MSQKADQTLAAVQKFAADFIDKNGKDDKISGTDLIQLSTALAFVGTNMYIIQILQSDKDFMWKVDKLQHVKKVVGEMVHGLVNSSIEKLLESAPVPTKDN